MNSKSNFCSILLSQMSKILYQTSNRTLGCCLVFLLFVFLFNHSAFPIQNNLWRLAWKCRFLIEQRQLFPDRNTVVNSSVLQLLLDFYFKWKAEITDELALIGRNDWNCIFNILLYQHVCRSSFFAYRGCPVYIFIRDNKLNWQERLPLS